MHPRMLYAEAEEAAEGDPYDFAERPEAKLALLILINTPEDKDEVKALAHELGCSLDQLQNGS